MIWQVTRSYRTNYAPVQAFAVDDLNQLINVSRAATLRTLTAPGSTTSPTTIVTVEGASATLFGDTRFARAGAAITNGLNVYTAIAQGTYRRTDTHSGSITLPSSVSLEHASKGTLTYDGYRRFAYDGLDRLRVVYPNGTLTYDPNRRFTYDNLDRLFVVYVTDSCKPFNRRRIRREYAWLNSGWSQFGEVRYVYDSNLVLCDGNGNVTLLTGSLLSTQRPVAKYIYDSFGNLITMSGPLAKANTCRFCSKDLPANTCLHHFGRTFYASNLQRWLNRDPIGIEGGINLYRYCGNAPVNAVDPWGLDIVSGDWINPAGETVHMTWDTELAARYGFQLVNPSPATGSSDDTDFLNDADFNFDQALANGTQNGSFIEGWQQSSTVIRYTGKELAKEGAWSGLWWLGGKFTGRWVERSWDSLRKWRSAKRTVKPGLPAIVPNDLFPYPKHPTSRVLAVGVDDGTYVFVQDVRGTVHIAQNGDHMHPKVLGNATPVASAGELTIKDGVVVEINNLSGTFKPKGSTLGRVQGAVEAQGLTVSPGAIHLFEWP